MNRIITSAVTDPTIQLPFTTKSLDFLQNRIEETDITVALRYYAPNQSTIAPIAYLNGLRRSGNIISSGYFFGGAFNPRTYYCEGADVSGFFNPPLVAPVFSYATSASTYPNNIVADPVTYTDNIARNSHEIQHYKIVDQPVGVAGAYLYSVFQFHGYSSTTVSTTGSWTGTCSALVDTSIGMVHLKGTLSILGSGSIGALPPGFRPSSLKTIPCVYVDDGTYKPAPFNIDTSGNITFTSSLTGSSQKGVFLDGISFYMGW